MFATLDRYLLREILYTLLAVTGVLLFILLSNQFARVLGEAAAGRLPREAVFQLMGLTSLQYLTILVPVSLFLAVMLAFGRLYKDSEMSAVMACGIGPARLYRPLMVVAILAAVLLSWLSLDLAPWSAETAHVLRKTAQRDAELSSLEAGRFRSTAGGDTVFYAESVTDNGMMANVFIQRQFGDEVQVAVAERGQLIRDGSDPFFVLFSGKRYEGVPGSSAFRIIEFREHGIPIELARPNLESEDPELQPTSKLLTSVRLADQAELQWRLSVPLSALVLALLALPLSKTSPRQGRYGKLAVAVLVYVVYSNLLGAARVWLERGLLPPVVGLWWVHAMVLLLTAALLLQHNRWQLGFVATRRARSKVPR
ncbi:MAG: LPS export ABC transporter permease LptF [Gammaproteobacteria bacterium]|nr:LPS export ABC transporter permease LptF [Gammaproteobacteria bacterium]